jgi:DNA-binding beta-propeller fold protein YncE
MSVKRPAIVGLFFVLFTRAACGQSPTVFLSEATRVIRFDAGAESTVVHGNAYGITTLNGNLLVANDYDAIQKYSPNGVLLGDFASIAFPAFLETDSKANVYTTAGVGSGRPVAARFNAAGVLTQTFDIPPTTGIFGIDADTEGNVYVVDRAIYPNAFLDKFSPNGALLSRTLLPTAKTATDIAIDEVGKRLFVADEFGGSQGIKIFDISGATPSYIRSITTPANGDYYGVDYAEDSGNILVVDDGIPSHDPRGLEYSPNGTLLREYRAFNGSNVYDIVALPVPEPSTAVMFHIGCVVALIVRRR